MEWASLNCADEYENDIDELEADEGDDDAADAVDDQISAQYDPRWCRPILHTAQRERNQSDDDQRVEDHARQNRGLRRVKAHQVERAERGIRGEKKSRNDREVLGDVVRDRKRR